MRKVHDIKEIRRIRKILRVSATPQEIILWSRLRRQEAGCKFRRQHSIGKYVVDFYCAKQKLIIEIDGWQHKQEKDERYDKERTKFFERLGFKVLRFCNNDINDNLPGVVLKIEEYLK